MTTSLHLPFSLTLSHTQNTPPPLTESPPPSSLLLHTHTLLRLLPFPEALRVYNHLLLFFNLPPPTHARTLSLSLTEKRYSLTHTHTHGANQRQLYALSPLPSRERCDLGRLPPSLLLDFEAVSPLLLDFEAVSPLLLDFEAVSPLLLDFELHSLGF